MYKRQGMGSRYGGLKQMDPLGPNGEAILEFSAYDAIRAGFDKIVFIIKKEMEKDFIELIGSKIAEKIEVEYVFQGMDSMLPEDVYKRQMLVFLISISNFLSNQNVTEKALNSDFVLEEKISQNELTKISGVPLIQQYPLLPNGCEAVSAAMILQYYGFDITAQEFVDEYLFMQPLYYENNILCGPDPSHAYAGNPYTVTDGLGCYCLLYTSRCV